MSRHTSESFCLIIILYCVVVAANRFGIEGNCMVSCNCIGLEYGNCSRRIIIGVNGAALQT